MVNNRRDKYAAEIITETGDFLKITMFESSEPFKYLRNHKIPPIFYFMIRNRLEEEISDFVTQCFYYEEKM